MKHIDSATDENAVHIFTDSSCTRKTIGMIMSCKCTSYRSLGCAEVPGIELIKAFEQGLICQEPVAVVSKS